MARDIFHDDWDTVAEAEVATVREPVRKTREQPQKDSLSALKDYVIVALIAVIVFMGFNNFIFARTGNNGYGAFSGGGGCCGGGGGGGAVLTTEELQTRGLEYYVSTAGEYGDAEIEAKVQDFGCHQEIYIYKNGELAMRVAYRGGQFYEIPNI